MAVEAGLVRVLGAFGLVAVGVGLFVALVFLHGQTLDHAAAWATVAGFFVSTIVGLAGLVLAWLAWRDARRGTGSRTGRIRQRNSDGSNLANTGRVGGSGGTRLPSTGSIEQRNRSGTNVANTGVMEGADPPHPPSRSSRPPD